MCQYWKNECVMTLEQAELEIGDSIHQLIKKKLVKVSGDSIKITFLDEQLVSIEDTSEQKRNAAKIRWNAKLSTSNAGAMHVHESAMQNDADKTREEKKRESITHGKGKITILIKPVYAHDPIHRIHQLDKYYESTGQLEALREIGLIHFDAFMQDNSGKVFNEPDHLYNTFRNFCKTYVPPARAPDPYKDAQWDKDAMTPEAWEEHYSYKLKHDGEFRKRFGYAEPPNGKAVGKLSTG
jgi:ribosome-associated protein YbcJ (S4-like RNA binding protein)